MPSLGRNARGAKSACFVETAQLARSSKRRRTRNSGRELFLQQTSGDKRSAGREQPLDPPQLNSLPVEKGPGTEEDADSECPYNTQQPDQKGDECGPCEPKSSREAGKFRQTWDQERSRGSSTGTPSTAGVAVDRAHDELAAAAAGCAAVHIGHGRGDRKWSSPIFVLRLIDHFRHRSL